MQKFLISCSIGLSLLLTNFGQNAKAGTIERYGDALVYLNGNTMTVDCGYATVRVCYRLHFDIYNGLHYVEVFPASGSSSIQLPPGTKLNNIPVEMVTENTDLGPLVDIVFPTED